MADAGWVSVGTDHDTAEFAVATIATWWRKAGSAAYPEASRLLISADGGGSNGHRTRLWKTELARLAEDTGLTVTVCHLPPGTSKWNKIEHRLFSHISMNWRGRPLTSHEVVVNTIAATTTRTGLTVTAELDTGSYAKGIKITDQQMRDLDVPPSATTSSTANGTTASRRAGQTHPEISVLLINRLLVPNDRQARALNALAYRTFEVLLQTGAVLGLMVVRQS